VSGKDRSVAGQLPLPLEAEPAGALPALIRPMLATPAPQPFDDEGYFFEPWWPGEHVFAFWEQRRLRLQAEQLSDPLAAFPELRIIGEQLAGEGAVLDGTLMVLDGDGRPDPELLRQRLSGADPTVGTGAFVASDLLWVGGEPQTGQSFSERRRRLTAVLHDGDRCVVSRGLRGEGVTLAAAAASMGLDGVSARRLDARWRPGDSGHDWLRLPVTETPAPTRRPLLVLLQRLPLEG
jgi:bifunctional non-homologous end joining protein LigD